MRGFFPPDSIETLVRFSADAFIIALAVRTDPVRLMNLIRGSAASGKTTSGPKPCTTEKSPAGKSASIKISVYGVYSWDFKITAFPQRSAGKAFQQIPAAGLLNEVIIAPVPMGTRANST